MIFEEGFEGVDPQPLHERINQALGSIGALVLSDYAKGALTKRADYDFPWRARRACRCSSIRKERILNVTAAPRC
ncbi:ADP-heptose synthase [Salmonella enterica subsp. enterica]|uniref:ADP-heptose synthase n=1 Tax=Salmonella enterica I TaxID=59201 RepID=A0A3S4JAM3_SALET|nr:ADP-heptose synthase [Salmonella enterica subsp. enterica]